MISLVIERSKWLRARQGITKQFPLWVWETKCGCALGHYTMKIIACGRNFNACSFDVYNKTRDQIVRVNDRFDFADITDEEQENKLKELFAQINVELMFT